MAFEVEWGNPIFYLNAAALLLLALALGRVRRAGGVWVWLWMVLLVGTALHFVGDLFGLSENTDHILIHAVLLVAVAGPAASLLKRSGP
jgi:hypothetical protein